MLPTGHYSGRAGPARHGRDGPIPTTGVEKLALVAWAEKSWLYPLPEGAVPMTWADQKSYHPDSHQGIYPICDLLEHMKELVLQNHSRRVSMTWDNRYLRGVLVRVKY